MLLLKRTISSLTGVWVVFLLSASWLVGQATWGTITGFVTDQTGAAVPNATVTVENERTGIQIRLQTDTSGLFNAPHLDPGMYSVKVEAPGFQTFTQEHVSLQVDSTVRVDPKMTVGQQTQQITVSSGIAEVETQKTDVSSVITEHEISSLPMVNHTVTRLYLDVPGVVPWTFQIGNVEMPSEGEMTSTNGQL